MILSKYDNDNGYDLKSFQLKYNDILKLSKISSKNNVCEIPNYSTNAHQIYNIQGSTQ